MRVPHEILDDPSKWTPDMAPPFFDAQGYQRRIDERTGKTRENKSILRLSWAPAVWTHSLGERVKRYWVRRERSEGEWVYISPPRWVIERRVEREAYWAGHMAARFQKNETTGEVVDIGAPPEEYYVYDDALIDHDDFYGEAILPQCCQTAWDGEVKYSLNHRLEFIPERVNSRRRCWGYYREPNESDLARVEKAVRVMNEDKFYNPYAPMSQEQILALEANANLDTQKMTAEADDYRRQSSEEFEYLYGWRLRETDAGKLSHGRYHFLGQTWKAGRHGLAVPV